MTAGYKYVAIIFLVIAGNSYYAHKGIYTLKGFADLEEAEDWIDQKVVDFTQADPDLDTDDYYMGEVYEL